MPSVLDLFCGCSGFGLGAEKAGFQIPLAVDIDRVLTSSHEYNFPNTRLMHADIAEVSGSYLLDLVKLKCVDGIIGGPPCQGFSSIGKRNVNDPRRDLIHHFFRLVDEISPAFFVMENVKGLYFESNKSLLDNEIEIVSARYEILGPVILDSAEFGAATRRQRLFVLGYDKNKMDAISILDLEKQLRQPATVLQAIGDLHDAVEIDSKDDYDVWKLLESDKISDYASKLRASDSLITGHKRTQHTKKVAERFSSVEMGKTEKVGRHHRLDWSGQCPTLRAGTGSDHGSYQSVRPIHPHEPRVVTVREAARLQGFHDSFRFHPTVWHSFRMIGNSVSPIIAEAILKAVSSRISYSKSS